MISFNFKNYFPIKFIGMAFLSGLISSLLAYSVSESSNQFFQFSTLLLGLWYGLITSKALRDKYQSNFNKKIWLVSATLSFVVVFVSIFVYTLNYFNFGFGWNPSGFEGNNLFIDFFYFFILSGVLPALILCTGFFFALRKGGVILSFIRATAILFTGGFLTYFLYFFLWNQQNFWILIIWPTVISAMLIWSIKDSGN